jgi:hypothetical protein
MLLRTVGLWREAGFQSLAHYCRERLGMGVRTVEQRIWLERRLYALPELREAMRGGRVSYEKARLVAGWATDRTVEGWIERAKGLTCIALEREVEAREETQMRARIRCSWRSSGASSAHGGEAAEVPVPDARSRARPTGAPRPRSPSEGRWRALPCR